MGIVLVRTIPIAELQSRLDVAKKPLLPRSIPDVSKLARKRSKKIKSEKSGAKRANDLSVKKAA